MFFQTPWKQVKWVLRYTNFEKTESWWKNLRARATRPRENWVNDFWFLRNWEDELCMWGLSARFQALKNCCRKSRPIFFYWSRSCCKASQIQLKLSQNSRLEIKPELKLKPDGKNISKSLRNSNEIIFTANLWRKLTQSFHSWVQKWKINLFKLNSEKIERMKKLLAWKVY